MSNDQAPPRNDKPCGQCDYFDPVLRGMKTTGWGWCAAKSLYPYADSPGQVTPLNAKRVASPTDVAKPKIVEPKGIEGSCALYKIQTKKPNKADLLAKAMGSAMPIAKPKR